MTPLPCMALPQHRVLRACSAGVLFSFESADVASDHSTPSGAGILQCTAHQVASHKLAQSPEWPYVGTGASCPPQGFAAHHLSILALIVSPSPSCATKAARLILPLLWTSNTGQKAFSDCRTESADIWLRSDVWRVCVRMRNKDVRVSRTIRNRLSLPWPGSRWVDTWIHG